MSEHLKELLGVLYTPGAAEVSSIAQRPSTRAARQTDRQADRCLLLFPLAARLGCQQLLSTLPTADGMLHRSSSAHLSPLRRLTRARVDL